MDDPTEVRRLFGSIRRKKSSRKLAQPANNNDLNVISISFLAFNFRGIIRWTSREPPSLAPARSHRSSFSKIRNAGLERAETRREVGESLSTDSENYFILSCPRIGRESRQRLAFSILPRFLFFFSSSVDHSKRKKRTSKIFLLYQLVSIYSWLRYLDFPQHF